MPIELIFLRPWWLLLIPVGFVLAFVVSRRHRNSWRRICDSELFSELTLIGDRVSERMVGISIVIGWLLAVIALAGPAWDRDQNTLYQSVDAMVVVFDLSRSMNSTDLLPSRLERARYKALEVIEAQQDMSVGLVAFAGDAFDVTPISDDIGTVSHLLHSLQIQMMPVQGSLASTGLYRAHQLLNNSGYRRGAVVLLTDGVDEDAFSAAKNLTDDGFRLSVVAVGTEAGAPISLDNGDFLKDGAGNFIVAPINVENLAKLAKQGGGLFSFVSEPFTESMLHTIDFGRDSVELTTHDDSSVGWNDRGPWILLGLLPLVALIFRRGWILSVLILLPVTFQDAHAFKWEDLWLRSDQQAAAAVREEDFDNSQLAEHPEWNGIALYRQNKYEEATAEFNKASDRVANFNAGNAKAKDGDLQGAIENYEAAIEIDSEFEDAQFNLDLVKKLLQEQQQRQRGQQDDSRESQESNSQNNEASSDQLERSSPNSGQGEEEELERRDEPRDEENQLASMEDSVDKEQEQLMEQWLQQIQDDPTGLLRRRFYYEYQERQGVARPAVAW